MECCSNGVLPRVKKALKDGKQRPGEEMMQRPSVL
jgi:hypothetical protein